ncbi:MAG: ABC transporter substrate-binding protein [Candidatus Eremiobacteraeota bacterium]|nr:ABC transporter substrate-binding protein [Candidatus Eremiobacteraeota bacterium]
MIVRRFAFLALLTSLAVVMTVQSSRGQGTPEAAPGAEVTGDTILIGQTAAQSGPNAPTGEAKFGLQAYFDSVNARGGVNGKKLKLISYDDGYQPSQTTALVKKLVYDDRVFAIVGSVGTPTNGAVYQTLDDSAVPLVAMSSGGPIFYHPTRKYVFPAWPLYSTDGKTMGEFVKRHFPHDSVAVIYQDDAFGKPILEGILSELGRPADMTLPYVPSQVDFSSDVIKLKSAGIKVVLFATIATPGAQIMNQMENLSYHPTRLLTSSACGYTGIFKTVPSIEGTYCTAFLPAPGSDDPRWTAFGKAMATYAPGHPAEIYAAWGWLAGEVTVAALRGIKGSITRDKFVAALNGLHGYDTIGGRLTYSAESHDGICCQFMWQAKGGRWNVMPDKPFDGLAAK